MPKHEDYVEGYLEFSAWPHGGLLSLKVRELVYMVMNAATHHLHEIGARTHMSNALAAGATRGEVLEALELTSQVGVATFHVALPILADELADAGIETPEVDPATRGQLLERLAEVEGEADEAWLVLAAYDPGFIDTYVDFASSVRRGGHLDAKTRELLLLASAAVCTNLDPQATRAHIRGALREGAHPKEIVEVLELISSIGIHTVSPLGFTMLEELAPEGS